MQENVLTLLEWYNCTTVVLSVSSVYLSAASLISALFELLYTNSKSHRSTIT